MIVLDASAAVDWLLQTPAGIQIGRRILARGQSLHAPHLIDLEVVQALRRLTRDGTITARRAEEGIEDLRALRLNRYPHFVFLPWIWQHRNNLTAYDACYVALAEQLGATLITRDAGLAGALGRAAKIEVL
jgi:predicted nucleic acid-binding protein